MSWCKETLIRFGVGSKGKKEDLREERSFDKRFFIK